MSLISFRLNLMFQKCHHLDLFKSVHIRRYVHFGHSMAAAPSLIQSDIKESMNKTDLNMPVHEFVASLSVEKRQNLLHELQKIESAGARKKAEDKLASWRWRSRFGRLSSLTKLGADPTGTYCEIPEGWLKEKAAFAAKPTVKQLKQLAVFNALPFIGFGFLDNLIMILAGDYIDATLGTAFSISTMAAAALGNTISDLAGIGSAFYVESAAEKIGVRAPNLTHQQMESAGARWSANAGRAFGVVFGCILGMFPLLFLKHDDKKTSKKPEADPDGTLNTK